jgi:transposase
MEVVSTHCCGIDVHKRQVVACVVVPGAGGKPRKETRTFGTMRGDLLALVDWLLGAGCTHVAMESTGVYWHPLYNLMEGVLEILVVNAQHSKQVPGRKTDVRDCEWIADLLRHGLLRASFLPARPQRELRELTRYRTTLVRERAAEVTRLQKTLEGANIKLAAVARDILGVSGRALREALVAGTSDPTVLAQLARRQLRGKIPQLARALAGQFGAHQRFMVAHQLVHIDALDELSAQVSAEIGARLQEQEEALVLLATITGVGRRTAEVLLAAVGADLRRFPSAGHLAAWAGLAPGNNQSAGKQRSGKTRKGSPWLRATLVEAAQAVGHTQTYLGAQYRRIAARCGRKRAAIAVAHSILVIAYHVLTTREPFHDLGATYFDKRNQQAVELRPTQPAA